MRREITTHKINGLNESLRIEAVDTPGVGGASHVYKISPNSGGAKCLAAYCSIYFQNGPIEESGVNGISQEALLAIVEDRLRGFQSGQYACEENAQALAHVCEAMEWLKKRTSARVARGVEGTSQI